MKRFISILLILIFALSLVSCEGGANVVSGKKSIVVTIFPEYDWVSQLLGNHKDDFDLTLLLDSGVDLHNYQPTASDIVKISNCDMFVYVGGTSDSWVDDVLAEAKNDKMIVLDLMDVLGSNVKEEVAVEGMEDDEEEEGDEIEYDEHVWLSLKNAEVICKEIKDSLCKIEPEFTDDFEKSYGEYNDKLTSLDEEYTKVLSVDDKKPMIFGDRFPFLYLASDYNLEYYAAFKGCSAESEASFETIKFLADKADEYGVKYIMKIDTGDEKIAKTIIESMKNQDVGILTLDSMQSKTTKDIENSVTYIDIMEENLSVLRNVFGG